MNRITVKGKKIKIMIFILYVLISSIVLSACQVAVGRKEIEDLGIVTAIGVDYIDGNVVVTMEVVNPLSNTSGDQSSASTEGNRYVYFKGIGKTVKEAITNVNLYFDKQIFFIP